MFTKAINSQMREGGEQFKRYFSSLVFKYIRKLIDLLKKRVERGSTLPHGFTRIFLIVYITIDYKNL